MFSGPNQNRQAQSSKTAPKTQVTPQWPLVKRQRVKGRQLHVVFSTVRMSCLLQIFSSTGRRPASLCHGPVSVVCPSVRASVRPCVNFFFKHLLRWNYLSDFDEISQICSHYGPLQNFLKLFDSFKNSGCHCNKTENFLKSLKIFLSETIRPRATKFGM